MSRFGQFDSQFSRRVDLCYGSGVERDEMSHFHFRFCQDDGFLKKGRCLFESPALHFDGAEGLVGELAVGIDLQRLLEEASTGFADGASLHRLLIDAVEIPLKATEPAMDVHVPVVRLYL